MSCLCRNILMLKMDIQEVRKNREEKEEEKKKEEREKCRRGGKRNKLLESLERSLKKFKKKKIFHCSLHMEFHASTTLFVFYGLDDVCLISYVLKNFMLPTLDLSFTGLDDFVNEPLVKNCKAMFSEEEPKVVRKCDDALIIKDWVSDDEEEDVSQPKIKKKTVRPSIVKKEFVKYKKQEKTARKTVKQIEQHR
ncbi:hypothetical protein Tco_1017422 [Tanacetum coccineum]|uniref:Uncharacterized protein n=1 Tax=Tanacetum coccineum TaxID=301880 RepID=A0ABQ5FRF3_9ASTR